MGAWGYGLYENDTSCDVRDFFLGVLKENNSHEGHEAFEVTLNHHSEELDDSNVVLALANLAITFSSLSKELYQKATEAIETELEEIENWSEPEKRMAFLSGYKSFLDVSVHQT